MQILFLFAAALLGGLALFTVFSSSRIAAAHPPAGRFVEVDGAAIHLIEARPAEPARATVLLVHGASGNQADMTTALGEKLIAQGYAYVAVDRPGHGWSGRTGLEDVSPARQAALIAAAVKAAGHDRVIALGHSFGGAIAAALALDHGDLVEGLVLVAPVTHPWPGGVSWYYGPSAAPVIGDAFTRLVTLPAGLTLMPGAVASVFAPQAPPEDFAQKTGLRLVLRPQAFRANAQDVASLKPFIVEQAKRYGELSLPVAIVTGDSDSIVYTHIHSHGSARDMKGATLRVLPGVGHAPHHTHGDAVVEAVDEIAARIAAEGGTRAAKAEAISSPRP